MFFPWAHGCGGIPWIMLISRELPLKKTYFLSLNSHQLLVAQNLGLLNPSSIHANIEWFDLVQVSCRWSQVPWDHECSSHSVSPEDIFIAVLSAFGSYNIVTSFSKLVSEPWEMGYENGSNLELSTPGKPVSCPYWKHRIMSSKRGMYLISAIPPTITMSPSSRSVSWKSSRCPWCWME